MLRARRRRAQASCVPSPGPVRASAGGRPIERGTSSFTFGATIRTTLRVLRNLLAPTALVACVASAAYLVGQRLRHDDDAPILTLVASMMVIVFVASAIMRQLD